MQHRRAFAAAFVVAAIAAALLATPAFRADARTKTFTYRCMLDGDAASVTVFVHNLTNSPGEVDLTGYDAAGNVSGLPGFSMDPRETVPQVFGSSFDGIAEFRSRSRLFVDALAVFDRGTVTADDDFARQVRCT